MEQTKVLNRRECVGAFVVVNKKILLGKRRAELDFYPNVWDAFGGHRRPDESLEETLCRELREELGITPLAWEFLTSAVEPDEAKNGAGSYHFYLVTVFDGEPRNLQPEVHDSIGWFDFEETVNVPLAHPLYAEIINEIAGKNKNCQES